MDAFSGRCVDGQMKTDLIAREGDRNLRTYVAHGFPAAHHRDISARMGIFEGRPIELYSQRVEQM
jgi:hypothetical protein